MSTTRRPGGMTWPIFASGHSCHQAVSVAGSVVACAFQSVKPLGGCLVPGARGMMGRPWRANGRTSSIVGGVFFTRTVLHCVSIVFPQIVGALGRGSRAHLFLAEAHESPCRWGTQQWC